MVLVDNFTQNRGGVSLCGRPSSLTHQQSGLLAVPVQVHHKPRHFTAKEAELVNTTLSTLLKMVKKGLYRFSTLKSLDHSNTESCPISSQKSFKHVNYLQ
uniref:Uncharacterized protein n=1 Tax=Graphocephala atropunctata TaxID=36148 RepID=A0A1B6LHP1_9HEMI